MRAKKGTELTRLRKGSKVEVFGTTKTIPGGFWRPAQIVCGNGRTYLVQYYFVPSSIKKTTNVEKVPRKMICPCPPAKDKPVNWIREDVVEVFVHGSWRVGKVTGVVYGNNFCFVLPIGHAREIAVKACNLRRQQVWVNNKWSLIKKVTPSISISSVPFIFLVFFILWIKYFWHDS